MNLCCGVAMTPQEALFAVEVHAGEFDQTRHLLAQPCARVAVVKLLPELIQGLEQDPVLIIHRFDTDTGSYRMPRGSTHKSPPMHLIFGWMGPLNNTASVEPRCDLGSIPGFKRLFENNFGRAFVPACGEHDRGGEDQDATHSGVVSEMLAEKLDAEDRTEHGLDIEKDASA